MDIGIVVLAAGLSRRMGEAKLLLPWGDTTILGATLQTLTQVDHSDFVVVGGGYFEEVEKVVAEYNKPVVFNKDFATGEMVSSLKVGVAELGTGVSGVLVCLGDMPLLEKETIGLVIETHQRFPKKIIVPTCAGRRGHPVLFSADYFDAILGLEDGGKPNVLLKDDVVEVKVEDEGVLIDIDTPEAYEELRKAVG